jgi:hypothetical protein
VGSNLLRRVVSKWWFWLGGVLGLLGAVLLCFAIGYKVWGYDEWVVYQYMEAECHPVWRDLHFGRIRAGNDIETVIARTRPSKVRRDGAQVTLEYYLNYDPQVKALHFTGVTIDANEGQLVSASAGSCTWMRLFFDTTGEVLEGFPGPYRTLSKRGAMWVGGVNDGWEPWSGRRTPLP